MKAIIFDVDGTLIDSVYPHALAWQQAFAGVGLDAPAWSIHRRIGMSGTLLARSVAREHGLQFSDSDIQKLDAHHSAIFRELAPTPKPLPGACKLLDFLRTAGIAHGIATSGKASDMERPLKLLGLSEKAIVVDGSMVKEVKPEPDLFLKCQQLLGIDRSQCLIVGDAIWDIHAARRSGILAVGLLSGGFGEQELYNAGAMRVFKDAEALYTAIDEIGLE